MKLKQHNDDLASRLKLLDKASDRQIAKEFFGLLEEKCQECQEDRLGCTVRPACRDRNFLNMLIELGINPEDLPSFCYGQYLEQIKRFVLERKGRGMVDRRLQAKDFLSTLRVSSLKHFVSRFGKIWTKTTTVQEANIKLVAGDDLVFQFDFARGIVIVNPQHHELEDFQTFRMYVELLSKHHGIESVASRITDSWWHLRIDLENAKSTKGEPLLEKDMLSHFEDFFVDEEGGSLHVEAEVLSDGPNRTFEVQVLHALFDKVSKLKKRKKAK
ncbi:MAG: hypothetical protein ACXADS_12340 [Candidatus Thorarchaeota archaeon]|jgi:hypothetical protein